MYSFADVSGSHFNPGITFGMVANRKISVKKGMAYIVAQLLASVLATLVLLISYPNPATTMQALVVDISTSSTLNMFVLEFMSSFVLVYVVFATALDSPLNLKSGSYKAAFAPLAIGTTIGALSVIGAAYNPARVFGPMVVSGGSGISEHWLFWVADSLGGAVAGFTQRELITYARNVCI